MAESVKNSKNFLVGTAKQRLCRTHLPSIQEVLAHFRYEHEVLKFTISKSCNSVAHTVHGIWKTAGFFPREEKNVCRSLMKLVAKWQRVKKQKETASEHMQFKKCMKGVFDIAVKNVESLLDKDHLSLWRKQKTSGVPIRLKKCSREKVQDKIEKPMKIAKCSVEEDNYSRMTDDEDPEFVCKQRTRRRIDVMTGLVAENLDREKVSNRGSVGLLGSTAAALGYDLDNLRLSHRRRKQPRQRLADTVKETFKKSDAIVVHFDSKQLLDGRRKREKLAVVVTGNGSPEQILSCEFIEHGTGRAVAEQVVHCLEEWGLTETIKAKSYDTTSVNSGQHNGASVIVSQLLGRQLLELPCRHHVYELVLMSAYKTSFNMKTSAPDDTLFKQFRVKWNSMDHSKYNCLEDNSLADTERSRLVAVFEDLLDKPYHRDDYAEFLQLGLMCLTTTKKFQFRPP